MERYFSNYELGLVYGQVSIARTGHKEQELREKEGKSKHFDKSRYPSNRRDTVASPRSIASDCKVQALTDYRQH